MLIICDFDGTVTARDTNSLLARRFAPDTFASLEGKLASRELTLREVLAAEYEGIRAAHADVVGAALEVPFRAGFEAFVSAVEAADASLTLLSSGFRELIEPMLEREGLAGRLSLVANAIELGAQGGRITWRDLPDCAHCGEPCKRHDVGELRASHAGDGRQVVFIGDGFSDRCGAEAADRILARDSLATYLDGIGVGYEPWEDFHDVATLLGL